MVLEKIWKYKDYFCVVIIQDMGHRCGYVALKRDVDENDISCHGGITYRDKEITDRLKEFVPEGTKIPRMEWIGFDCAHAGDSPDIQHIKSQEYRDFFVQHPRTGVVRSLEFCIQQCHQIVDQLEVMP